MQQAQQRELPERMSWARAIIFATGFFFISAILMGQLPGYIFLQMTAASLEGLERGTLALAAVCLGGFIIIQVIMWLFDPKPVFPPIIFTGLGGLLAVAGFALTAWAYLADFQYFPTNDTVWFPLLGGKVLWFQPRAVDFIMVGLTLLGIGLALIFYSRLALREQANPDRRDPGTTPAVRLMLIIASTTLVIFLVAYTLVNNEGLAALIANNIYGVVPTLPENPTQTLVAQHDAIVAQHAFVSKLVNLVVYCILGAVIMLTVAAFGLRLHYLMRPVRKKTMAPLYAVGAFGLAQTGAISLLVWIIVYPLVAWIRTWSFIGLNDYLVFCSNDNLVPASCSFSAQTGYIIVAGVVTGFFVALIAAIWAWKTNRNLVIIGSVVTIAAIAMATLLIHTKPDQLLIVMILTAGMLILGAVWTSVARREFAVVGENNLGCLGMWLVLGTCLFIYLAAFAFFSMPIFPPETEANIPFKTGLLIAAPHAAGAEGGAEAAAGGGADAMIVLFLVGILAAVQFYFLVRNRYKV